MAQGRARRSINQALTRPQTVAGAEKGPLGIVVTGGVMFGMFAWLFFSVVCLGASLALFFVGVPLVRRMAKADPQMVAVYRANVRFADRYPAREAAAGGR